MFGFDTPQLALLAITFFAAFVNGALGYGFSSLTVPVALLFFANRVLNPSLVIVEVFINVFVLIMNRRSLPAVWPRVWPILVGLAPGVVLGSVLLASLQPAWIKFGTYLLILPMILIQAAGARRPIKSERLVGLPLGAGVGFLYSVTTISGPPLAVLFNNQGLVKSEFRGALGLIRVAESSLTALAYYHLGLFSAESQSLVGLVVPSVLIGIPLGTFVIRHMDPEVFRRICMSFDVYIVAFGLSRVAIDLRLAEGWPAYSALAVAILLDAYLLRAFFMRRRRSPRTLVLPVPEPVDGARAMTGLRTASAVPVTND
jgi:uncharacterized protein